MYPTSTLTRTRTLPLCYGVVTCAWMLSLVTALGWFGRREFSMLWPAWMLCFGKKDAPHHPYNGFSFICSLLKVTINCCCCCCCCSHINSHNQVRGHRTGSSHSHRYWQVVALYRYSEYKGSAPRLARQPPAALTQGRIRQNCEGGSTNRPVWCNSLFDNAKSYL